MLLSGFVLEWFRQLRIMKALENTGKGTEVLGFISAAPHSPTVNHRHFTLSCRATPSPCMQKLITPEGIPGGVCTFPRIKDSHPEQSHSEGWDYSVWSNKPSTPSTA